MSCVGLLSSVLICMDTAHTCYGISLYFCTSRFQLCFPPAGLCHSSLSPFGVPSVPGAHAQPSPQGCSPALPSVWGRGQTSRGCISLYFFPSSLDCKNAFRRWKMILHFPNWLRFFPSICNKSLLFFPPLSPNELELMGLFRCMSDAHLCYRVTWERRLPQKVALGLL